MEFILSKLTVFFEDPFWVGVYEQQCGDLYEVSKIVFGTEPKDYEVYNFVLKNWNNLKFSPVIKSDVIVQKQINPKRMQRLINKQLDNVGVGTKAQNALKEQRSQIKTQKKICFREKRDYEKERRFKLRQEKRKQKHKGH